MSQGSFEEAVPIKANGTFRRCLITGVAIGLLAASFGVAEISASASSSASWTVKLPNLVSSTPNYEFPYATSPYFSQTTVTDFQQLQYRPLYWFGGPNSVTINASESLATTPVFSSNDKTVTVNLKPGLKWSNGEAVTSANVLLWMNLMAAVPSGWANYISPLNRRVLSIPDIISSIAAPSATSVVFHLSTAVSPQWFLYDELSQITPLPQAWDIVTTGWTPGTTPIYTASNAVSASGGNLAYTSAISSCPASRWIGDGNDGPASNFNDINGTATVVPSSEVSAAQYCTEVFSLMSAYSMDTNDYAATNTNTYKLFQVTDGPWHLTSYNLSQGNYALARVSSYRGTVTGTAKNLDFVPCTSDQTCYNLVLAGAVTQGELPAEYAKPIANLSLVSRAQSSGAQKAGYRLVVNDPWSFNYAVINFDSALGSSGDNGRILSQTYVRQALNELSNQALVIKNYLKGLGYETTGPVPAQPASPLGSPMTSPAFPFSISKAKALLIANGWNIVGGVMTCIKPGVGKGDCGAGIKAGDTLNFQVLYSSGSSQEQQVEQLFRTNCAAAGIKITLSAASFDSVLGVSSVAGATNWDLADWGNGWIYFPHYDPTGENLFATGAIANSGAYSNVTADKEILGTVFGGVTLTQYDKFMALSDPVIYHADTVGLVEVKSSVKGFGVSPLGTFTPENWSE